MKSLCPVLERHAIQRFGSSVSVAGWQDFSRWGEEATAHEKNSYQSAFTVWWLFSWLPDDQGLQTEKFSSPVPDYAIAADYLALQRGKLSPLEQRVIERALTSPFSFYKVLSIEANNRLRLQEIYTQTKVLVEANDNIRCAEGNVLFTAVLNVDSVSVLLGCMPHALSANCHTNVEAHREKWRAEVGVAIDKRLLYLHDTELRRFYFMLLSRKRQIH